MDQMDWGDADDFVTTGAVGADQVGAPSPIWYTVCSNREAITLFSRSKCCRWRLINKVTMHDLLL